MPSKALLHPGEVLDEIRAVAGAREAADGQLAVQAVLDNRDAIISDLDDSSQVPWLEDNDISLFRGHGRIAGEKRVVVGDEELLARIAVVIAIGSEPTLPDVEGLSHANPWTNREATTSKIVPGRLLIIGGGVVGAEMAQAYTSLGAKVTVFQRGTQLLAKEEPWAAEQVAARLREQGTEIVSNAEVAKVERRGGTGDVTVRLQDGRSFTGDELLVAIGRHIDSDGRASTRSGYSWASTATWPLTSTCRSPATTGSGSSGTPRVAPCSRTWPSTRPEWPPTGSPASQTPRSGTAPTALARRG